MASVMKNLCIICGLLFAIILVRGTEVSTTSEPPISETPSFNTDEGIMHTCAPEQMIYGPCYCVSTGNEFRVTCKTNDTAGLANAMVRLQRIFNTTLDFLIHQRGKFSLRPFFNLFNEIVPAERRKNGGRFVIKERRREGGEFW